MIGDSRKIGGVLGSVILAGDIGGTNARLALFEVQGRELKLVREGLFLSRNYEALEEIVSEFARSQQCRMEGACFGIAGPIKNAVARTPNLPWVVEAARIAAELGLASVQLLNDLEANAHGIGVLAGGDTICINAGSRDWNGNQAVISAGTGLGEAGICWDGERYRVLASEGGHGDFAARSDLEIELLCYLQRQFDHVSYERVLSGPGLVNIYNFLRDTGRGEEPAWLKQEIDSGVSAAVISRAALTGKSPLCVQALDLFVSIFGAEAGNLGLRLMAIGGVFLGGGIAPKIASKLTSPAFIEAFTAKGRMRVMMESMPIHIITNEKTALLGAARVAAQSLAARRSVGADTTAA
jgi:glucokinase